MAGLHRSRIREGFTDDSNRVWKRSEVSDVAFLSREKLTADKSAKSSNDRKY